MELLSTITKVVLGTHKMERMLTRFCVREKAVKPFKMEDDFNPPNVLEGFLCTEDGPFYGSMLITSINDGPAEQWVFATPKFDYPFDRSGAWNFPDARAIEIYRKLDGTNVLAYSYAFEEKMFVTYKLRLNPIVRNSGKWGPFQDMLNEMLQKYGDEIQRLVREHPYNLSFELYGSRNKHLMVYGVPLELCFLFLVDKANGTIFPPSVLKAHALLVPETLRVEAADTVSLYKTHQENDEKKIKKTELGLEGDEGWMWYMLTANGKWLAYKCKPPSVEEIHWKAGLSKNVIRATAFNALEHEEEITYDGVRTLLLETFSERDVDAQKALIEAALQEIRQELEFEQDVREHYHAVGVSIWQDKAKVMRAMSAYYPKQKMKLVYWLIANKFS